METLFLSLTVLLAAGILPLLGHRLFTLMKACYVALTITGCVIGLYSLCPISQLPSQSTLVVDWLHIFQLQFSLDSLSTFFLIPVFFVCPLAVLYVFHYMNKKAEHARTGVNFFFFNLLIIAMALVVIADNMISFALSWEIMSLASFFLVLHEYEQETTRRAGYIYLLFTQLGALCIFLGMGVGYGYTQSLDFAPLSTLPEGLKLWMFCLVLVGFGSKAGVFPIHIWLPYAHPAAPSNISAIMSGVMIKMGIYGVVRFYGLLDISSPVAGQIVLSFGIVSGVLGVIYALGKQDIKKLLAYSSVENIGVILIGLGVGMIGATQGNTGMAIFGFVGGLLHVLNHSLFKSLLFLGAGTVAKQTGTRQLDQLGGLIKRMPLTGKSFLIGSVSISGLPPFNGFVSEFLIYIGAFQGLVLGGMHCVFAMLAILALALIGGLAAACFTRIVGIVFLGEPRADNSAAAKEAGWTMTFPMVILAASCLIIGVWPEPFVHYAFKGVETLLVQTTLDEVLLLEITQKMALASQVFLGLFVVLLVARKFLYRGKQVQSGPTWGCGFTQPTVRIQYTGTSYAMSIVEFFRPMVRLHTHYAGIKRIFPSQASYETHVDDIAEQTLIERIVEPLLFLLGKLRWIQHGHIQLYIGYIIITILVALLCISEGPREILRGLL
ncbi:proton-conducting transporter transmembrane domain-containing protein [Desulfogranum japonicum]|uniref:proton-conducting transporter transmembrane domain-containing protein n=1 Tax=Desulfogranum japonicum TaxID=231447 RepID=UPI000404B531|nr:proton-conducting transporter membrane subunit [Desulfogranum japonicum]